MLAGMTTTTPHTIHIGGVGAPRRAAGRRRRAARHRPRRLDRPHRLRRRRRAARPLVPVIRYDRRGHSRSEYGGPAPRRRDEDDLAELIEALGLGPAHLLGTSYGACDLARRSRSAGPTSCAACSPTSRRCSASSPTATWRRCSRASGTSSRPATPPAGRGGSSRRPSSRPGAWDRLPEPLRRAAIGNAQTFVDLREDPGWATLDLAALARVPRPILITVGETSPPWLRESPVIVAERAGIPTRQIPGAGHSPHLTHPDALVGAIIRR